MTLSEWWLLRVGKLEDKGVWCRKRLCGRGGSCIDHRKRRTGTRARTPLKTKNTFAETVGIPVVDGSMKEEEGTRTGNPARERTAYTQERMMSSIAILYHLHPV